ncbi:MAG: glycosyltransferase [Silicimonas sp.]|nr:glycosyltransferase [Silicimonas sp.]
MEALIPLLLVAAAIMAVPPAAPDKPFRSAAVVAGFSLLLGNYLWWRLTVTVLPAQGLSFGTGFVWAVFLGELWLWYETLQLSLILLRRTDRSPEADAHEARLEGRPPDDLPAVDVMIATYNEPLDVLEKTIAGALALDWPRARLNIHVLDDGRRDWLARYCHERGVNHITRDDNAHAKAGNLNAAFRRTKAPFILVLDADFVPQRRMLMRAIGFFEDPGIGIVQMPHHFFNDTPLQTNLDMRASLPDEQRFFFDTIQPGRDGWDCAFCCGSNGIIRREALDAIGGQMPTESITEDMLLTLAMLRKGYVTRYLGERLAVGLAPETLDAYFVQRGRWAQGGIQLLYTRRGPLGPGLNLIQRLFFNPSHWLSQSICQPLVMATPAIFLLTGAPPLLQASFEDVARYQLTTIVAAFGFVHFLAPRDFAPIASTVEGMLQSFRLLPLVLATLIRPRGHGFKVTPKGSDAGLSREDRFTIVVALSLILATGTGLFLNADFGTRIVGAGELLPVVAFWSVFNMLVLLIVMTMAVPRPAFRAAERFAMDEPCRIVTPAATVGAEIVNISMSGVLVAPDGDTSKLAPGGWAGLEVGGVGIVPARLRRRAVIDGRNGLGFEIHLPSGPKRDVLIQKLFSNLPAARPADSVAVSGLTMLARVFEAAPDTRRPAEAVARDEVTALPDWLAEMTGELTFAAREREIA